MLVNTDFLGKWTRMRLLQWEKLAYPIITSVFGRKMTLRGLQEKA
jgi:hypothetical protein